MRRISFLLLALSLLPCSEPVARELTLTDAIEMAKSHSYQLKAAKAQSDAFEQNLRAAIAERLPTLSLTALASYKSESPETNIGLPGSGFTISLSPNEAYQTDVRLALPLYTGGRISGGVDLAKATQDYYSALADAAEDQILLAARVVYLSLYRADQLVNAAEAQLVRAQVIEKDVQSLFDAGAADSVNILDARMAITNATFAVQAAQSTRRQAEIDLAVLLGIEPSENITIARAIPAPPPGEPEPIPLSSSKPELLAANSSITMSRSLVALNRADYLPSLSLFGGYSWGKPNIDPFHDEFNDYFVVGANLNWSFNIGGKSGRNVSKARQQLTAARHNFDQTREQLDLKASLALENLKLVRQQYETARENFRIASDNYRLAGEKHRQGVLSANRLLEIEASLSEAEFSLARTQADFYIVQSQYLFAIGSEKITEGI